MWPSVWLTGLSLFAVAAPPASQAFVPSTVAKAAAATGHQQPQQKLQQQLMKQRRSGVGMAATRRDVVRMPSSEPMVRESTTVVVCNDRMCCVMVACTATETAATAVVRLARTRGLSPGSLDSPGFFLRAAVEFLAGGAFWTIEDKNTVFLGRLHGLQKHRLDRST